MPRVTRIETDHDLERFSHRFDESPALEDVAPLAVLAIVGREPEVTFRSVWYERDRLLTSFDPLFESISCGILAGGMRAQEIVVLGQPPERFVVLCILVNHFGEQGDRFTDA